MLEVGRECIVFEPDCGSDASSSTGTRNFFDRSTSRICTVRNNGALSFTCKTFNQPAISTRTKDKGPATDVKISPNGRMASVRRHTSSVDLVLTDKTDSTGAAVEFNVATKSREPIILAEWVNNNQLLFVTSQCMELMSIIPDKKTFKLLRSTNISAAWAVYYAPSNLVLLASGPNSTIFQPVVIHHGQFTRLKPFEVEISIGNTRDHVLETDVFLTSIYGSIYALVIRYNGRNSSTAELLMYELSSDVNIPAKLRHTLSIGFTDCFGINVIDNLVVVHHQPTARSLVYDIALAPNRPSHSALINTTINIYAGCQPPPSLYTFSWRMFFPDIIADPVVGIMYQIGLRCAVADAEIEDKCTLIEFLINRTGQENLILETLLNSLRLRRLKLRHTRKLFALLAANLVAPPTIRPIEPTKSQLVPDPVILPKLDQKAMQGGVFIPLKEDTNIERTYLADVMLHYLNSLNNAGIPVDAYFLDMLVEVLAEGGQMQKLQQLVTYRVIDETKQLAYMLVSYAARCPHISNAALDILSRQKAAEEILEIMLENGFVIEAARYMDSFPVSDTYIHKLVETTAKKDRHTAYAVHSLLSRKNRSGRLTATDQLYPEEEIAEAEKQVALCTILE